MYTLAGFEPVSIVPKADAVTTAPRRRKSANVDRRYNFMGRSRHPVHLGSDDPEDPDARDRGDTPRDRFYETPFRPKMLRANLYSSICNQ
jgi:hypothetical protein